MSKFFTRFAQDESGATAIEYGLIAALISITIIAAAQSIGGSIKNKFSHVNDCVSYSGSVAPATC
jgi:pilus assembly protein Flp/PilA